MSESGEGLPQPEKELSQEELKRNVTELTEQFKVQFENSVVKKSGMPQEIPSSDPFRPFAHHDDPRILIYGGGDILSRSKGSPYWRIDQSVENEKEIVKGKGSIYETVIITTGESPSVQYKFEDMHYDKEQPKQPMKQSQNTPSAIKKAKEIIADIPQVKK